MWFRLSTTYQKKEIFHLCPYQVETNCELISNYMNFMKQPIYKPTQKLVCDLTNKQTYMMHHRMFKFYINMGMKVTKRHKFYRCKQIPWLAKYIDHSTQESTKAKTNVEKVLYKVMNNAFFGETIDNIRDRTNLEFLDHSQMNQILKRQSKLSRKGMVDHYSMFSVYKFDKKNSLWWTNFFGVLCVRLK